MTKHMTILLCGLLTSMLGALLLKSPVSAMGDCMWIARPTCADYCYTQPEVELYCLSEMPEGCELVAAYPDCNLQCEEYDHVAWCVYG